MRRPKTYLLDEDQHLQNLRKIIKRDFFVNNQPKQQNNDQTIPLRLNDYISNFKSNQNHIFAELVHADSQDWKKKHQWMQKAKQLMIQPSKQQKQKFYANMICKDPTIKSIDYSIVKQDAKNAIFFSPTRKTVSYNDPQHDKLKRVDYQNCRIQSEQIQRAKNYRIQHFLDPNLQKIPSTPILQGRKQMKNSGKYQTQKQYSIKRIPSPQPQKLPIMTWGQIQSTPMRIAGQSEYRIPQKSSRDDLLDQLTSKITKQKLIKKNRKQDMKIKILSSMRPVASSYRKVSVARQNSQKRTQGNKQQKSNNKLDNLLKLQK